MLGMQKVDQFVKTCDHRYSPLFSRIKQDRLILEPLRQGWERKNETLSMIRLPDILLQTSFNLAETTRRVVRLLTLYE